MKDLFETPELIPSDVQSVFDTFDEDAPNGYHELDRILTAIEPLGYTFEYYLDAEPYALRPIGIELNQIEGYEEDN